MLGDNAEKSKNPLKKAMRRRNAKTVTFSSPTNFETYEDEYSTEEDEDKDQFFEDEEVTSRTSSQQTQEDLSNDEDMVVQPLRPKHQNQQNQTQAQAEPQQQQSQQEEQQQQQPQPRQEQQQQQPIQSVAEVSEQETAGKDSMDQQDVDKEGEFPKSTSNAFVTCAWILIIPQTEEVTRGRSRNGTVRNTDSFFKDDSVETKKISLTPNLLRDDAGESASVDSREVSPRPRYIPCVG